MSDVLKTQLLALRELCRAQIAAIDALLPALDRPPAPPAPGGECPHPAGMRRVIRTMGSAERWICGACGATGGATGDVTPQQEG